MHFEIESLPTRIRYFANAKTDTVSTMKSKLNATISSKKASGSVFWRLFEFGELTRGTEVAIVLKIMHFAAQGQRKIDRQERNASCKMSMIEDSASEMDW